MRSPRTSRVLRIGVTLAVITLPIALIVWLMVRPGADPHAGRSDVVRAYLVPIPEGPRSPLFVADDRLGNAIDRLPISDVASAIPDPLPPPLRWQGWMCQQGGNLVFDLADGRSVTYGPCRKPDPIETLELSIVDAARQASHVVAVTVASHPRGHILLRFSSDPSGDELPLDAFAPKTRLYAEPPRTDRCDDGFIVRFTMGDGRTLRYGPCLPISLRQLVELAVIRNDPKGL